MSHRVLITGANGFIAQHILSQFLQAGHSVRAVVRTQSSADRLRATFSSYVPSKLDFALVPDITVPGAFDTALVAEPPFDIVLHTASPFDFRKGNSNADFLSPAINGTTEILRGIVRKAPSVKRVVVTSSTAAVMDPLAPPITDPPKIYTERDWFQISRQDAETTDHPVLPYVASKTLAERAAWDFVAAEKPGFDLVTVNPPIVYGPVYDLSLFKSPQELSQSNFMLYEGFFAPGLTADSPLPAMVMHIYVDVRDVARAHLLAVTKPEAGGNRFIVSPGGISTQRIANILREKLPGLQERIPRGDPENPALPEGIYGVDTSLAKNVLGLEYTEEEKTIGDIASQLIELEERAKKAT
ncbi:putative NADPH-dependent methylglyoxal reductase GRP2-like protein 3 [Colletotrichum chlorophyti]|uniref:Putative NADPH-dependent methylglyoxal reductase GRP2-like protein 3 n=1 Tax=Colletotrichum chlorophyti TaxID=708187 RepID=A0A1Q8S1J3_9PEZI|nr:putative NADPH-dependent methylglyoxal reductase GRP2-like protein 3 [Colletotrichum chlorophyti]